MVLFSNINLNQRVELKYEYRTLRGTVKYKGPLVSKDGDWVGVALDEKEGSHGGLYMGRRYFECKNGHGVFVRAGSLRLIQNTRRCLFNKYHRRYDSGIDESLFGASVVPEVKNGPRDPILLSSQEFKRRSQDVFDTTGSRYSPNRSFLLSGSVSKHLPAATMTRPYTAALVYSYASRPVHNQRMEKELWDPVPSIPKTHMPRRAQKNQNKRGWDHVHWTREISVPTARESMKHKAWNDTSY